MDADHREKVFNEEIMGTNYYLRKNICECCERFDQLHIGKSSGGWSFSFRGYKKWHPEHDEETEEILSFSDWKEKFKIPGAKIFDEYGAECSIADFISMVEAKRDGTNHTTYCQTHHSQHAREDCWLDDEGNSFDKAQFR